MDESHPIFSHQSQIGNELSKYVIQIFVVTDLMGVNTFENIVENLNTNWKQNRRLLSLGRCLAKVNPVLLRE